MEQRVLCDSTSAHSVTAIQETSASAAKFLQRGLRILYTNAATNKKRKSYIERNPCHRDSFDLRILIQSIWFKNINTKYFILTPIFWLKQKKVTAWIKKKYIIRVWLNSENIWYNNIEKWRPIKIRVRESDQHLNTVGWTQWWKQNLVWLRFHPLSRWNCQLKCTREENCVFRLWPVVVVHGVWPVSVVKSHTVVESCSW